MDIRSARRSVSAVLLVIGLGLAAGACSSGPATAGPSSTPTPEAAVAWFGDAMELVHQCEQGVEAVVAAVRTFGASASGSSTSLDIVTAAGQAIESCTVFDEDVARLQQWTTLASELPDLTASLQAWVDASLAAEVDALVAAATNADNRDLVGRYVDSARAADDAATTFEAQVRSLVSSLGVTVPDGELLVRWNPPDH